ncbi:MAG: dihydrolipoyl dehydrogenase [Tissierellales bacterium]|nr:dihydrolipoyl dehydrogenase [Tissierellales bacterium]
MEKFDCVVLGGGPGGYIAAIKLSQMGKKVAVVEKDRLGGICLNWGCIPTKTLLSYAKHFQDILRSEDFGIMGIDKSKIYVDIEKMMKNKDDVVNKLVSGIGMLFKKNKVTLYNGYGKVLDENHIDVEGKTISFEYLIIATGAKPYIPNIKGLKTAFESNKAINNIGILGLKEKLNSVIILGSNTYAVEYATFFNAIGTDVTMIFKEKNILTDFDSELSQTLERQLKKSGIKIVNNANIIEVKEDKVIISQKDKEKEFSADKYIVFLGIRPNLSGLENLNLEKNEKEFIKVNENLKTNIENIYAIGDVNGNMPLAHVASFEGIVASENICGINSKVDYKKLPSVVYSFPEVASVGYTEDEAKERKINYSVGKFPMSANSMGIAKGETTGFVKILIDKEMYGEIIGMHIISSDASNMISEGVSLMGIEATAYDLSRIVHPHPTFTEAIVEASLDAIDKPLNI